MNFSNFIVLVSEGNVYSDTVWVMSSPPISGVVVGSTSIYFEDAFKQVIRVTPGYGIVDLFSARTYETSYIRHQAESIYYVWADKSLCLNSEGICAIVSVDNEFYDSISEATYLSDVTFTSDPISGISTIYSIEYGERRNNLKNLASALEDALNKAFLFILVGYIVHFFNGNTDMRQMGGIYLYSFDIAVLLFGACFNLAGLPYSAGFLGKEFLLFQVLRDDFLSLIVRAC